MANWLLLDQTWIPDICLFPKHPDQIRSNLHGNSKTNSACVAAISGTGIVGIRANDVVRIFLCAFLPDVVYKADVWKVADDAVLAAGIFANDWTIDSDDISFGR